MGYIVIIEPMEGHSEIDSIFHNSETGGPFSNCLMCNKELIQSNEQYLIEKVMRRVPALNLTEVLFEYAICMNCAQQTHEQMSKSSREAVERFFHENVKHGIIKLEGDRLDFCVFTGKRIDATLEYSLHAQCIGDKMVQSVFPYAMSDDAMDQIVNRLSNETLDELDRFKNEYFGGPPELEDVLSPRRLLPF